MRYTASGVAILLTALVLIPATTPSARGCGYGVPSPLARFTSAEWVVVGKIITFDQNTVKALPQPGAQAKQEYAVAVLEIIKAIKGAEGLTHIRVALDMTQHLQLDKEACFFLNPHFEEPFCVMPRRFGAPEYKENNPGFDNVVEQYERWGSLLKDPVEGLKSKDAEERFLTAALVITEHRTFRPGFHAPNRKAEPIDANLSELILRALAEADWSKAILDNTVSGPLLFAQLAPTAKDGWKPVHGENAKVSEAAAKQWLKDNAAKFRISAFVQG